MVGARGLEPRTSSVSRKRSTPELRAQTSHSDSTVRPPPSQERVLVQQMRLHLPPLRGGWVLTHCATNSFGVRLPKASADGCHCRMVSEFGRRYAIASDLIFPLQLSQVRPAAEAIALRRAQAREFARIKPYIDGLRASRDESFWKTNEYAFRVYLVPKLQKTRREGDPLAIPIACPH